MMLAFAADAAWLFRPLFLPLILIIFAYLRHYLPCHADAYAMPPFFRFTLLPYYFSLARFAYAIDYFSFDIFFRYYIHYSRLCFRHYFHEAFSSLSAAIAASPCRFRHYF
jgi:hypothetical protein